MYSTGSANLKKLAPDYKTLTWAVLNSIPELQLQNLCITIGQFLVPNTKSFGPNPQL